ncbi:DnaJ family domain-containing protein [Ectobacillus sp. sgz5001026]|uniref:DnaJ family domain-containing protein n=1 Tax=Ectobacillus sp. sgz5001026 TaxID=3242473 RepID=UPI0036D3D5EC
MGNNPNLIDQIIKDSKMDEEVKKIPGFGKPFPNSFFSGDVYSNFLNIAKDAGYLPPWINLQKEIREKIASTLQMMEQNAMESTIKDAMDEINVKITKYNEICPPSMQRGRISLENIADRYKLWE